jgi:hypothetical protein
LWNDGKGHFPTSTKVGPAAAWIRIGAAGDFDGDRRLDLAIIDEQKRGAYVLFNRGGRNFGDPVQLPGPPRPPYALAVADLNRDGRPDIIVGSGSSRDPSTTTPGRDTASMRSPGTTAKGSSTACRMPTSMVTVGPTLWRRGRTPRTESGAAHHQSRGNNCFRLVKETCGQRNFGTHGRSRIFTSECL